LPSSIDLSRPQVSPRPSQKNKTGIFSLFQQEKSKVKKKKEDRRVRRRAELVDFPRQGKKRPSEHCIPALPMLLRIYNDPAGPARPGC
jgi:hypothetical protein